MATGDVDQFRELVDQLQLPSRVDAIVILRNWDHRLTQERYEHGCRLLYTDIAPIMCMTYDSHTLAEAQRVYRMSLKQGWNDIILVTHKNHSYRALLTFLSVFGKGIYISQVPSAIDMEEFDKIDRYQRKGDICSYEEGIKWLLYGMIFPI